MADFDYKNASDVEALTHVMAVTLDDVKYEIDQLPDSLDLDFSKPEHLNIIADLLAYQIDKEDDPDFQRKQLRVAIDSYKTKGTVESVKVLFYTLGFNVEVIPLWTPTYVDYIPVYPPFISVSSSPATDIPQTVDVIVINPDNQSDTKVNSYEYK